MHLAQLNIARLLHPLDDPRVADFVDGLERINELAERTDGFVWRLKTDLGNALQAEHPWSSDPLMIVNMSVWTSVESLKTFAYRSEHLEYFSRRSEWFEKALQPNTVLWWIAEGVVPTVGEAKERLEHFRAHGATPHAFWFSKIFPAPATE